MQKNIIEAGLAGGGGIDVQWVAVPAQAVDCGLLGADYVRVDRFRQAANDPWSLWSHAWTPKSTGTYMIRLRVTDPVVEAKRLDSGYYVNFIFSAGPGSIEKVRAKFKLDPEVYRQSYQRLPEKREKPAKRLVKAK